MSATYPDAAGHQATDTSREAASLLKKLTQRHEDILWSLAKWGPMTPDEIASSLGLDILGTRPRLTELRIRRRVYDTGKRKPNKSGRRAIVYDLTPSDK